MIGLGVLSVSTRLGRFMDAERDRLQDGAPAINSVFVDQGTGGSAWKLPLACGALVVAGVVLIVTAFTAH